MKNLETLGTIELKEGFYAQYYSNSINTHPDTLLYRVRFDQGIPLTAVEWCDNNCKGKWGWIHINLDPRKTIPHCEESYLLFEVETDAILFKLQYNF